MPRKNPFMLDIMTVRKRKKGKASYASTNDLIGLVNTSMYVSASISLAKTIKDAAK